MSKELETIKSFQNKRTFDVTYDNGTQKHYETKTIGELFPKEINKIEAELKALEIIKKKKVDVALLFYTNNADMYNRAKQFYNHNKLTQEEYELLKEILK